MAATINASSSSGIVTTADNSAQLELQTGNTTAITVNSSQNVGIGTTSPSVKLEVIGTSTIFRDSNAVNTNSNTRLLGGAYTGNPFTLINAVGSSGANALRFGGGTTVGEPATSINFYTGTAGATGAGTERMRIDSSGNVGIGTTSPGVRTLAVVSATDKSTVGVFSGASYGVRIGTIAAVGGVIEGVDTTGISSYQPLVVGGSQVQFTTSGTERLRIDSAGQIGIAGANYGTSGQVLTSGGPSAAPSWTTISGGVTSLNGQTGAITNTGYGDIGSYYIGYGSANTAYSVGSTIAGSSLTYVSSSTFGGFSTIVTSTNTSANQISNQNSGTKTSSGLSGTWRCMTRGGSTPAGGMAQLHLWVRIS